MTTAGIGPDHSSSRGKPGQIKEGKMSKLIQHLALIALIFFGIAADSTHGAPITQPSGLTPGAEYRLAFLTSTTRDATSSNIEDYNTFVTNAAAAVPELAALNTTWKAIASTAAVDARDNSDTRPSGVSGGSLGARIFLLNDTLLTNNNDALWNTLQFAFHTLLNINENGDAVVGDQKPWTGTSTIGTDREPPALRDQRHIDDTRVVRRPGRRRVRRHCRPEHRPGQLESERVRGCLAQRRPVR
jgi:hypothetical protein